VARVGLAGRQGPRSPRVRSAPRRGQGAGRRRSRRSARAGAKAAAAAQALIACERSRLQALEDIWYVGACCWVLQAWGAAQEGGRGRVSM
jgi:hypothetical protein